MAMVAAWPAPWATSITALVAPAPRPATTFGAAAVPAMLIAAPPPLAATMAEPPVEMTLAGVATPLITLLDTLTLRAPAPVAVVDATMPDWPPKMALFAVT